MHPVVSLRIVLPYQLVKLQVVSDVGEPPHSFVFVAVDAEICGLTSHMLGVSHTTHGIVECQTAKTAANLHLPAPPVTERLKDIATESCEVHHLLYARLVFDAFCFCCCAGGHFLQREVLRESYCHIYFNLSIFEFSKYRPRVRFYSFQWLLFRFLFPRALCLFDD